MVYDYKLKATIPLMKKYFTDSLLCMFLYLIGVLTLLNPTGHTPLPLIISMIMCMFLILDLMLGRKMVYTIVAEDIVLILFLFVSLLSVLYNLNTFHLNTNHILAEFSVLFFFYFIIKIALF